MEFSIEFEAEPGEVYLTQFLVRPDCPTMATRELAEEAMRRQFPHHVLRFHYGLLQYRDEGISPAEYAERFMRNEPEAIRNESFGGAVFGKPIQKKSIRREDVAAVNA